MRVVERRPGATVFVAALLWALVVTWPLALHLRSAIYGFPGDALGTISDFWWFDFALHHGRSLLYNELRGVPLGSGWETAYFDVLQLALFAPLSFVVGPTAAYNLGMLVSFPLTAWVTFLLGRRLGMSPLAAAFAGLAFAFVPYHQEKAMVHLMHTHMELFAGFLYFGVRWRQTGSWWSVVGAGAVIGLALWTDPTMFYLTAVLAVAFVVTSLAVRPREGKWGNQFASHALAALGASVVAALFVPAVYAVSIRGGRHAGSFADQFAVSQRGVTELVTYSSRLKEYVQPWHLNPLLPHSVRAAETAALHGSNFTEQTLTIGFAVIALAVIGLIAYRRAYAAWLCVAVAVVGLIMSQPPERTVAGMVIPAPSHYLFSLLPIFRAYSRFGMLVLLGFALLAGFGFMLLQSRLSSARRWVLAVPFLLVAVEFNALPPTHVLVLLPAPAEYTWLHGQPAGTLIEYPIAVRSVDPAAGTLIEEDNRVYTYYQQVHEHPMFNGAVPGSPAYERAFALEPYYAPGVGQQLQSLGIRYVFVHRAAYAGFGRDPDQPLSGYHRVATMDDTDVYVSDSS